MCRCEDMVMYSSDYPHWDFDHPKLALAPLPRDIRVKVQALNAAQLYGLQGRPSSHEGESP
jgi:predicted TIM-barrel fold metal-dependent hydrolase